MEIIKFKDYTKLGDYMYKIALCGASITAVLFYDDVVSLMKWLLEYDDINIGNIQISEDYESEYYITIDECLYLNIKPVVNKEKLLVEENTDYMLFDGDTSNKIALHNKDCKKYEISFGNSGNICGDCCEDCTNCSQRKIVESINSTLDFFDYLISHYND